MGWIWTVRGLVVLLCLSSVAPARAREDEVQRYLRHILELAHERGRLVVRGERLVEEDFIQEVYGRSQFERVWTDSDNVKQLLQAIRDIKKDGLDPEDYGLHDLEGLVGKLELTEDPTLAVDLDLRLTDALYRLGYHILFGKVDPQRIDDTFNIDVRWKGDPATTVLEMLREGKVYEGLEAMKPTLPIYEQLRKTLAEYRAYQKAGGWKPIPLGRVVRIGGKDPRIPAVRHRLAITGDLPKSEDNGEESFDEGLEQGLVGFQKRHRLRQGKLDPQTIRAMNVPVKRRIDTIRVNLERARWVARGLPERYLVVNIAAFEIYYMKDGKRVWEKPVQVGKKYSKTPLFRDTIRYLVLNPVWTVPPSVVRERVIPGARKNAKQYFEKSRLRVLTRDGRPVNPVRVNWHNVTADNFPYVLRQDPGANNALGSVIFKFPNPYHVYLHDTPNQLAYGARSRTISWGCIHVYEPLELAELLVDDPEWDLAALEAQVESRKTETIHLKTPMPVLLMYWTVHRDGGDLPQFLPDVYNRDSRVLRALKRPFVVRKKARRSHGASAR